MDDPFEPVLRGFLDCLPVEWLEGELHVTRVPRPGGGESLKLAITHPKGKKGECGPSDKLQRHLGKFVKSGPEGWTSFHVKVKQKRGGGWDVEKEFLKEEAPPSDAGEPVNDWVANSRQMDFGLRFLGTFTRLCVRKKRKAGWVLEESGWFLFIPLGTRTTRLSGTDRIYAYVDLHSGKNIVELEAHGRPSITVYEGRSKARKEWLVETLQQLLCVPIHTTRVF
jgi:hypothetical protein